MKRSTSAALTALAATALIPIGASSAEAVGKTTYKSCYSYTVTSDQRRASAICDTPGTSYQFAVQCSWYSAGKGGSFWKNSSWTRDRTRAYIDCGSAYVTAVGYTVYYR